MGLFGLTNRQQPKQTHLPPNIHHETNPQLSIGRLSACPNLDNGHLFAAPQKKPHKGAFIYSSINRRCVSAVFDVIANTVGFGEHLSEQGFDIIQSGNWA